MTDRNLISPKMFIVMHIIGAVPICIGLPVLFHREIGFWGVISVVLLIAWGCLMSISERRNRLSVWIDLLFPVELIAVLLRDRRTEWLFYVLTVIFALLALIYAALVLRSGCYRRGHFRIYRIQLRWILLGIRTIFVTVMSVFLMTTAICCRIPSIPTQISAHELSCSVESREDSLSSLAVSKFKTLTREDKLNVLRDVCRVEFTELRVTHGFSLEYGELDDKTLAQYNESNYTVAINSKYIDSQNSFSLVHAMCHECFHARQYELLRGNDSLGRYTKEEIEELQTVYREELSDYCTPHEDRERYRAQNIEKDANTYAYQACMKYLRFYDISAEQYADILFSVEKTP